jgi:hypothetical protein
LAERGVRLTGRVTGASGRELTFADDLVATATAADSKLIGCSAGSITSRRRRGWTTKSIRRTGHATSPTGPTPGPLGNPWRRSTVSAR